MADFKQIFSKYGFSLFETEGVEKAIIDAIKNRELRYIYGIPLVLERADIDYKLLLSLAEKEDIKENVCEILAITARLATDVRKRDYLKKLAGTIKPGTKYSPGEFEDTFAQYQSLGSGGGFLPQLNYWLSSIFTQKQIEILYKVKDRKPLSKTEKEYYSRIIKKRLTAIKELAPLASEILQGR